MSEALITGDGSDGLEEFAADIAAVVSAAEPVGVKLMLELPLLDARQREQAVRAAGCGLRTGARRASVRA